MNELPSPGRPTLSPLFRGRGAVCGGDDPHRVTEGSITRLGIRFSGDESRTTHEEVASDVAALPSALPSVLLTDIIGGHVNPCRPQFDRAATWGRCRPPCRDHIWLHRRHHHPADPAVARRLVRPTLSLPQPCSHPTDPRRMLPTSPLTQGTGIRPRRCPCRRRPAFPVSAPKA